MSDRYFERRLIEELRAAQQATDRRERSVHLHACSLLHSLLGLGVKRAPALVRRSVERPPRR